MHVTWNSITSTDSSKLERVQRKLAASSNCKFVVGVFCNSYEGIIARLNLSTLYSRLRYADALFLINVFESKISCSSIFDSVNVRTPTRISTEYCQFKINQNFKISLSFRRVSVANDICRGTDVFSKDYISLTDIL
jgi:hypothetical protein